MQNEILNAAGKTISTPGLGCIAGSTFRGGDLLKVTLSYDYKWSQYLDYVELLASSFVRRFNYTIEDDRVLLVKLSPKTRADELAVFLISLRAPYSNWGMTGMRCSNFMGNVTSLSADTGLPKMLCLLYLAAIQEYSDKLSSSYEHFLASAPRPFQENGHMFFNMDLMTAPVIAECIKRAYKFGGEYKIVGFQGRISNTNTYGQGISATVFTGNKKLKVKLGRLPTVADRAGTVNGINREKQPKTCKDLINLFNTRVNDHLPPDLKLKML